MLKGRAEKDSGEKTNFFSFCADEHQLLHNDWLSDGLAQRETFAYVYASV